MHDCQNCIDRTGVYQAKCQRCEARRIARMPDKLRTKALSGRPELTELAREEWRIDAMRGVHHQEGSGRESGQ